MATLQPLIDPKTDKSRRTDSGKCPHCLGKTKDNSTCKRRTCKFAPFCWQHFLNLPDDFDPKIIEILDRAVSENVISVAQKDKLEAKHVKFTGKPMIIVPGTPEAEPREYVAETPENRAPPIKETQENIAPRRKPSPPSFNQNAPDTPDSQRIQGTAKPKELQRTLEPDSKLSQRQRKEETPPISPLETMEEYEVRNLEEPVVQDVEFEKLTQEAYAKPKPVVKKVTVAQQLEALHNKKNKTNADWEKLGKLTERQNKFNKFLRLKNKHF